MSVFDEHKEFEEINTRIICGFPCIGKTWVFNHQQELNIICKDSDSSTYSKTDEWFIKYVADIKCDAHSGKYDFIFVSTHKDVINELIKQRIYFFCIYPEHYLKNEWIKRLFSRADDNVSKIVSEKYDDFVNELHSNQSPFKKDICINNEFIYLSHILKTLPPKTC